MDLKTNFKRYQGEGKISVEDCETIKRLMFSISDAVCRRLDAIEEKLEGVSINSKYLEDKLEQNLESASIPLSSTTDQFGLVRWQSSGNGCSATDKKSNATGSSLNSDRQKYDVVALNSFRLIVMPWTTTDVFNVIHRTHVDHSPTLTASTEVSRGLSQLITDYMSCFEMVEERPVTAWRLNLGVIYTRNLAHINSHCQNPTKMALTLLDFLFDRDTLASSNLSGLSRHGKKKLNPLLIFGIKCHLIHRFNITESNWCQIKLNIDSKCRAAFSRKLRGMSLSVKAFRGRNTSKNFVTNSLISFAEEQQQDIATDEDVKFVQLLTTSHGQIQVIQATTEQLAQLQEFNHIQTLQSNIMDLNAIPDITQQEPEYTTPVIKLETNEDEKTKIPERRNFSCPLQPY